MLTKKEIQVLELRKKSLTQQQVAKKLKISQAAVSIFEKKAYQKIRQSKKTLSLAKEYHMEVKREE